jgi:hypothetical protein
MRPRKLEMWLALLMMLAFAGCKKDAPAAT